MNTYSLGEMIDQLHKGVTAVNEDGLEVRFNIAGHLVCLKDGSWHYYTISEKDKGSRWTFQEVE